MWPLLVLLLAAPPPIQRTELRVTTTDGVHIAVRELRPSAARKGIEPIVLLHGARVPAIGSFDLPIPGGSLAEDLALRTGARVYLPDARGFGGSDRPPAMSRPPEQSRPLSRSFEVVRDVDAVVRTVLARTGARRVTLLGWATGGLWAGQYAALWPERVGHLVLLNALYGGSADHPVIGPGSSLADPARPDRLSPDLGGYARADAASLLRPWDRALGADPAARRDPVIAEAYVREALASDPDSGRTTPPSLRTPLGALEDSFAQASGRRLYDAGSITAAVVLVRGSADFWSRPEDVQAFAHDAVRARSVRIVEIPDATHFLHLERAEAGRARLLEVVSEAVR
ncbi:MAG TPA: alpha/beta fold hydrolase [Myxococcaceae bacterium]|nr:alpha/beta fold hydrolase [Myxococcaceae bacterium]